MDAEPVRVARLDCWHANEVIYQATGETDDGRHVYVHSRGGRFSVWVGPVPFLEAPLDAGAWLYDGEPCRPPCPPEAITRGVLASWTAGRVEWPGRIDGFHNEPEGESEPG